MRHFFRKIIILFNSHYLTILMLVYLLSLTFYVQLTEKYRKIVRLHKNVYQRQVFVFKLPIALRTHRE